MPAEFIGTIKMFAFSWTPLGYTPCNGQLLSIVDYQPLYAVIGTRYGGDARINFAVPDLRGKVPVHKGQSPGLSNWILGQDKGTYMVTLDEHNLPLHNHNIYVSKNSAVTASPHNEYLAKPVDTTLPLYYDLTDISTPYVSMSSKAISNKGENFGHLNVMPCKAINFAIATEGIFPQRP